MPRQETRLPQVQGKRVQIVIDLEFPPRIIDAAGTVTYGRITHVESKGMDADGNEAGNVYWAHEEVPSEAKAALVSNALPFLAPLLAQAGIVIDMTPTPYEEPEGI